MRKHDNMFYEIKKLNSGNTVLILYKIDAETHEHEMKIITNPDLHTLNRIIKQYMHIDQLEPKFNPLNPREDDKSTS